MGTSYSSGGPTGPNSLLPPWAPDLDPESEPAPDGPTEPDGSLDDGGLSSQDTPTPHLTDPPEWSSLLRQTTRLASGGATGRSARTRARNVVRNYVRTRGGAWKAAQGSVAGRSTGSQNRCLPRRCLLGTASTKHSAISGSTSTSEGRQTTY